MEHQRCANMPAQGNALGKLSNNDPALKGRNKGCPPFQGLRIFCRPTQGVYSPARHPPLVPAAASLGWHVSGPLALHCRERQKCLTSSGCPAFLHTFFQRNLYESPARRKRPAFADCARMVRTEPRPENVGPSLSNPSGLLAGWWGRRWWSSSEKGGFTPFLDADGSGGTPRLLLCHSMMACRKTASFFAYYRKSARGGT